MSQRTNKKDFRFLFNGRGHYKVIYTSPKTLKEFSTITDNMQLIDATKNCESPTQANLIHLKKLCKGKHNYEPGK